ncbi:MAG: FprA family A-type flavoprotein [Clostridia bacterium]|nr:FprA family A-type flavoprotein [Clostridia bacterium]
MKITENIYYVGVDDKTLDLFESQYIVPNGISYNSYIVFDDKITVFDTADKRATDKWFANLENTLNGKIPDYLVVSHMEPDHAANIINFCKKYDDAKVIMSAKALSMMPQFFDEDISERCIVVKDNEKISTGKHEFTFIMAPMIHWPEVMVTYDSYDKVLFSADAFGKFGALDTDEDWTCEARRYYFNIVGKYGAQVQVLLKKAAELNIKTICPLHGPVLSENLEFYINKYNIWSSYEPEDDGVFIAYSSIHGNTRKAVEKLAEILKEKGAKKIQVSDLARDDMAENIEDAFRYDKMIVAACTYDGGLFPCMEDFLNHLKAKTYRNRKVGIIENGSWGPMAAKYMKKYLEEMKDISICEKIVTIKSAMKESDVDQLNALADEILSK